MRASISSAVVAAGLLAAGCGSGAKVAFAEVSGTVTYGGQPLVGAEVTFYPVATGGEGLPHSVGVTDAAGKYTLTQAGGRQPGAAVGKCRAVVNWPLRDRTDDRDKAPPPKAQPTLPVRYTVAAETPFQVEVKAGGPQTIDLSLDR